MARVFASPAELVLIKETSPQMVAIQRRFFSLNELREFVSQTICGKEHLVPEAFRMTERLLLRSGTPCGVYFCLHGPRSVKFSAIWETDRNTILFYDSNGERFLRTKLASAPALSLAAA